MIKIKIVFYCSSFRFEEINCGFFFNAGREVDLVFESKKYYGRLGNYFLVYLTCRMSVECELA